jgi:hypothetical protein
MTFVPFAAAVAAAFVAGGVVAEKTLRRHGRIVDDRFPPRSGDAQGRPASRTVGRPTPHRGWRP